VCFKCEALCQLSFSRRLLAPGARPGRRRPKLRPQGEGGTFKRQSRPLTAAITYAGVDGKFNQVKAERTLMTDEMEAAVSELALQITAQEADLWARKIETDLANLGSDASMSAQDDGTPHPRTVSIAPGW
jgi:hypothetical protein